MQEAETSTVDLPNEELSIVKLLIQFLYEADYDPIIPNEQQSASASVSTRPIYHNESEMHRYTYDFPHTCQPGCLFPSCFVCPHHLCDCDTCDDSCVGFVCKICEPSPKLRHALRAVLPSFSSTARSTRSPTNTTSKTCKSSYASNSSRHARNTGTPSNSWMPLFMLAQVRWRQTTDFATLSSKLLLVTSSC